MSSTHDKTSSTGAFFIKLLVTLAILALGAIGINFLLKKSPKPAPIIKTADKAPRVKTTSVGAAALNIPIKLNGIVEAGDIRTLSSNVNGTVVEIASSFADDDAIKKGQLLFRVDNTQFDDQLSQLNAQLTTANSVLRTAKLTAESNYRALKDMGVKGTLNTPQVVEANAQVRAIKQQVNAIKRKQSKAKMYAPSSAKVLKRTINVGDFVTLGMPIAQTHARDKVRARFSVSDQELDLLGKQRFTPTGGGADVTVTQDNISSTWTGHIKRWEKGNALNNQSNTLIATINHPFNPSNAEETLNAGDAVVTTINSLDVPGLLSLESSLLRNGNQVWVFQNGKLKIKTVEVKYRGKQTAYVTGLSEQDTLVVSNIHLPIDGMKLKASQE
ncbi:MAG: efflux RND transporter periplasmic adaptor subunit [Pseudomonadota bacterium]